MKTESLLKQGGSISWNKVWSSSVPYWFILSFCRLITSIPVKTSAVPTAVLVAYRKANDPIQQFATQSRPNPHSQTISHRHLFQTLHIPIPIIFYIILSYIPAKKNICLLRVCGFSMSMFVFFSMSMFVFFSILIVWNFFKKAFLV